MSVEVSPGETVSSGKRCLEKSTGRHRDVLSCNDPECNAEEHLAHIQGIRDGDGNGNVGLAKDCIDGLDQRGLEMGF